MAQEKPIYIAVNGIDFPKERVEAGDPIPPTVKPEVVADLLKHGDIKEAK